MQVWGRNGIASARVMSLPIVGLFVSLAVVTSERRGYQSPYEALVPRGHQ